MAVWTALKNDSWYVFVQDRKRGLRQSKKIGTKKDAEKAARALRQALNEQALGIAPSHGPTLRTYLPQWLEHTVKPWRKPATYTNYCIAWRKWIAPHLDCDRPLGTYTKADIRAMVARWHETGLSRSSIKSFLAVLSACFTHAADEQGPDGRPLVVANPCARALPVVRGQGKGHKGTALTADQARHLLAAVQTKFPHWYPLILLWLRSGLRLGEALALRWGDVDLDQSCIYVRRTLAYATPEKFHSAKSGQEEAVVDMSRQLARALAAHRPATASDADLVFPSTRKTVLNPSNVRNRVWKMLFRDAHGNPIPDLPYVRIHDLRHTFVTLLLQAEKDMVYAQQQARHASIRTTVDSYGHLRPGYNRAGVNKLDDPEEVDVH